MDGLAGDARLTATKAATTFCGSKGADNLRGNEGKDILMGGDGNDEMLLQGADDFQGSGASFDYSHGGPGADEIRKRRRLRHIRWR